MRKNADLKLQYESHWKFFFAHEWINQEVLKSLKNNKNYLLKMKGWPLTDAVQLFAAPLGGEFRFTHWNIDIQVTL